uniref:HTH CENPB-type domain-containing protein n=1 Tax=Pelodiscus sinensis TaxID=13735 RepID=K7F4N8_PELSI
QVKREKKVVLSIEQKLEALKRLDKGESMLKIASELGVGRVTVGDWKRKRSELASNEGLKNRKTMKKSERSFVLMVHTAKGWGMPITGPILQEKALIFQKEPDFTACVDWLHRWKKRYGLRQLSICGEKLSANQEGFLKFKGKFHCLIDNEGLSGEQIYNCDETGLNYKLLPSKTLASRAEASAPGYKQHKERVMILACSNATGNYKLRLTFIGKAKKPQAFKNLAMVSLPFSYKNQRNAWKISYFSLPFSYKKFVPSVEQSLKSLNLPRKAILVTDNVPSHPHEDELISGDFRVIFLPPNITSLCQPLDQGVLEALKKKYRCKLLTTLIEAIDDRSGMPDKIKDFIYWIAQSWENIEPQTLARSWRKLLSEDENIQEMMQENCDNLLPLLQQIPGCEKVNDDDIQEWMEKDEQQELTDHFIIALVNQDEDEDTNDNDKMERMSHSEGVKALEAALAYVQQQGRIIINKPDFISVRREKCDIKVSYYKEKGTQ